MIKVAKFGGSSVANATQFQKVASIVKGDDARKFIVVSACGKEGEDDHKVTDLLYLCRAHMKYGVSYEEIFSMIEKKYYDIAETLKVNVDLKSHFDAIREKMDKNMNVDYLVSRGEYLSGILMAEYLDGVFIDAADVIAFDFDGQINMEESKERLLKKLEGVPGEKRVVIPGFYGSLPNGVIKVMSRGGSDITGAVLAGILDADVYENWTDVSGVLVANPTIVKNPKPIDRISYNELREMSYMGANVLHEEVIFPVKEKNIPINIRNTNAPEDKGTMIMENCDKYDEKDPPHFITGITGKQNYTVITVIKSHASSEEGFLRRILDVFDKYKIHIESIPASVDCFGFVVAHKQVESCLYEVCNAIKEKIKADEIRIATNISLVAVVGRGMAYKPGMSALVFAEFGKQNINIRMINQGSDEITIMVGVDDKDYEKAIRCIYERFISA